MSDNFQLTDTLTHVYCPASTIVLQSYYMAATTMLSVRVPAEWLKRFDRLAKRSKLDPDELAALGVQTASRSVLIRQALLRGLIELEAENPKPKRKKR